MTTDSIGIELTDIGPDTNAAIEVMTEILMERGFAPNEQIASIVLSDGGHLFSVNGEAKALDIQKRFAAVGATVALSR